MATENKKKKIKKNIPVGIAHVNATFNNTIITITDTKGNTISWSSAGAEGFKGSRKSTPFAAQLAAENAGKKAKDNGVKTLEIEVRGPGSGNSNICQMQKWAPRRGETPAEAKKGAKMSTAPRRDAQRNLNGRLVGLTFKLYRSPQK